MFSRSARVSRVILSTVILVACSDGSTPTQPTAAHTRSVDSRKAVADGVIGALVTPTVIYACYVPQKGTMYRIKTSDTQQECDKKDVQFSWTDQGSAAIRGIVFASSAATLPDNGRFFASCPDGKSVMNFGWEIPSNSTATASQIRGNRPTLVSGRSLWVFIAAPQTAYVFYWNCADADETTATS